MYNRRNKWGALHLGGWQGFRVGCRLIHGDFSISVIRFGCQDSKKKRRISNVDRVRLLKSRWKMEIAVNGWCHDIGPHLYLHRDSWVENVLWEDAGSWGPSIISHCERVCAHYITLMYACEWVDMSLHLTSPELYLPPSVPGPAGRGVPTRCTYSSLPC